MTEPTHAELQIQLTTVSRQLDDLAQRLNHMEERQDTLFKLFDTLEGGQRELFKLATAGKASLRTLLWVGGALFAAGTLAVTIYNGWHR